MLRGVDVSHHDGAIDWSLVARGGYAFAFCKASEGTEMVDATYAAHVAHARQCQLLVGAYHYLTSGAGGAEQAGHFLGVVGGHAALRGMLPPVLDVEQRDGLSLRQYTDKIRAFSDRVLQDVGVRPVLYLSVDYARNQVLPELTDHRLWVAHYTAQGPWDNPSATPWGGWSFWQYGEKGMVKGINDAKATTDLDVFGGSAAELAGIVVK